MSALAVTTSVLRHSVRSVRSGGLPFFFATLMTGLGLFSLGAFATLLVNFQRLASTIGESVATVAFLDVDSAGEAEEIRATVALDPRVREARLVTPEEALKRAKRGLGTAGAAMQGSAGLQMPWVVEITPRFDVSQVDARGALSEAVRAIDGVDELMHPGGELDRVTALMRLLHGAGAFLGMLIGLVVIVVVSNAVKITVFQRKDEIAIMKLVGATDFFVRTPFLLSGLVQGTLGAMVGLAALAIAHASLAGVVKVALSGALGAFLLEPMPLSLWLLLLVSGSLLGTLGAALSVGRFLRV